MTRTCSGCQAVLPDKAAFCPSCGTATPAAGERHSGAPDREEQLRGALAARYAIDREVGAGGMATVYLAEDLKHRRRVAIKVLRPELAAAMGAERFLREIEIAAGLNHPHILPLLDSGRANGLLYYVMPYVEGPSLRDRLRRESQLPVDDAIRIACEVAAALSYAHSRGVVHRDIKPENILLHHDEAVVADFGIARAFDSIPEVALTQTGTAIGTPAYMSPEQCGGESSIDGRSDTYSLACVLFEMLVGEPPFLGPSAKAILARHAVERIPSVRAVRQTVPEHVERVIHRALEKVPADRFATATLFAEALRGATTDPEGAPGSGGGAGHDLGSATPPKRPADLAPVPPPARHRTIPRRAGIAIASLGVLAVAGASAVFLARGTRPTVVETERQLTFEGTVRQATMSADGRWVGFLSNSPVEGKPFGNTLVRVMEIGGGPAITIDSTDTFVCCITWSPDGRHLLYRRGPRYNGTAVIVPRLGGARRPVTADVIATWAPDGSRLVSWWPQAQRLWLTDVTTGDTSGSVPVGEDHDWTTGVDWSPSQNHLVVNTNKGNATTMRTITLDGTVVDTLYHDSAFVGAPRWMDERSIYFLRDDDLWKVPVTAAGTGRGEPALVRSGLSVFTWNGSTQLYSISQDGTRILYVRSSGYSTLWRFSPDGTGGDNAAARLPLAMGTATRYTPRISPDGKWIVYVETAGGQSNLFVQSIDGGDRRQLTFLEGTPISPAWSRDGTRIVFSTWDEGREELWTVSVASGALTRLAGPHYADAGDISWAPGRFIVYQGGGDREIRLFDPATRQDRLVVDGGARSWFYDPRPSASGDLVAFRRSGSESLRGLWEVLLEDSAPRRVSSTLTTPIGYTLNDDAIYAMSVGGRRSLARELYRVPRNGADPELFLELPPGYGTNPWHVTISPDGRYVVAAVFNSTNDVWIIDGFDPEPR